MLKSSPEPLNFQPHSAFLDYYSFIGNSHCVCHRKTGNSSRNRPGDDL